MYQLHGTGWQRVTSLARVGYKCFMLARLLVASFPWINTKKFISSAPRQLPHPLRAYLARLISVWLSSQCPVSTGIVDSSSSSCTRPGVPAVDSQGEGKQAAGPVTYSQARRTPELISCLLIQSVSWWRPGWNNPIISNNYSYSENQNNANNLLEFQKITNT